MLELADRPSKQLLERVYKGKEKHNENTDGESQERNVIPKKDQMEDCRPLFPRKSHCSRPAHRRQRVALKTGSI